MNTIVNDNIKKYKVLLYIIITFFLSWIIWGVSYYFSIGILNRNINNKYIFSVAMILIGAFMPSTVSVIITGYFYGNNEVKKLLKRLTKWKINPIFYIFSLFYIPATFFIPLFICNITGNYYKVNLHINFYTIIPNFIFYAVFFGPLGEELGWRGFILPRLQNKFNPLLSSLILGIVWTCWHIPLFFIPVSAQYGTPFPIFVVQTILLSIILTWMNNHTKGSLLFSILFHTSVNFTAAVLFSYNTYLFSKINKFLIVFIVMQSIILLCIIFDMIRMPSSKLVNTNNNIL